MTEQDTNEPIILDDPERQLDWSDIEDGTLTATVPDEQDDTPDAEGAADTANTEDDADEPDKPADDPRVKKARTEAAKYRKRAQDAEATRDSALELVDNIASAAVAGFLTEYGVKPGFILDAGYNPLDFIHDGVMDYNAVLTAVKNQEQKTGARVFPARSDGQPVKLRDLGSPGGEIGSPLDGADWSDVLRS